MGNGIETKINQETNDKRQYDKYGEEPHWMHEVQITWQGNKSKKTPRCHLNK